MKIKQLVINCQKDKALKHETIEMAIRLFFFILGLSLIMVAVVTFSLSFFWPELEIFSFTIALRSSSFWTLFGGLFSLAIAIDNEGNGELIWP